MRKRFTTIWDVIATSASIDLVIGAALALGTWLFYPHQPALQERAVTVMAGLLALGVSVLALSLTTLAILTALIGREYVALLERTERGFRGAMLPYQVTAIVASGGALVSLVGVVLWENLSPMLARLTLAGSVGFAGWAIIGAVQLVLLTAEHATNRAELIRIAQTEMRRMRGRPQEQSPPEEQERKAGL